MAERIEKENLISQEALDALAKLADDIIRAEQSFKKLLKASQDVNKQLTAAQGQKELNKQTLEAAKLQNKLAIEAKKYEESLKKLELAAKRTALATEKQAIATDKHNQKLKEGAKNTNTWSNALGSFAFKFNFLGNAMASVAKWSAALAVEVGKKLLGAFVSFFTLTERGMELMERKTAGFKAAIGVLSNEFIRLGEAITGNQDKATKWGGVFQGAIRWLTGAANLIPAFNRELKKLTSEMNNASAAAEAYTLEQQKLEDLQRSQIVSRAEANRALKQARLDFEDDTLSIEERIAALHNSLVMEEKIADAEIELQKQVVAQIESVNAEKAKANQLLDSDLLKLEQAKAKVIELETESLGRQLKAQKTFNKAVADLKNKEKEDFERREKEKRDAFNLTQIENLKRYNESVDEGRKLSLKALNDAFEDIDSWVQAELEAEEKVTENKKTEAEKRLAIEKENQEKEDELKRQIIEGGFEVAGAAFDGYLSTKEQRNAVAMEKELKAAEGNEAKQEEIKKKYARKQQQIDIKKAIINGLVGVGKTFAEYGFTPPGWVAAAILTALTGVQVATIAAQKFAKGTDSSPEGLAWVGEKGRELMISPSGEVGMSPDKATLTYLRKGTKVIPNDITQNLLDGASPRNTNQSRQQNELIPYMQQLVNKPVTHVNIDNTGISVMTETATTLTKRVDKYFRK